MWAVVWPAIAGVLMYDDLSCRDLRDGLADIELALWIAVATIVRATGAAVSP